MSSHFSSLGMTLSSMQECTAIVERILPLAKTIDVVGGRYVQWASPSGAEVWMQFNRQQQMVGLTPYFTGQSRIRVNITNRVARPDDSPLDGAFHGWADPQQGQNNPGTYPFVFDVPDHLLYSDLQIPSTASVHIAAFAHELKVYPSVAAFNAEPGEWAKFASQSFIPSGLFSAAGESHAAPNAHAIFAGHVVDGGIRHNSLTNQPFYWAQVDSLSGSFDVVADPALCETPPTSGGVVVGQFWLCGRLIDFECKPRKGILGKLFSGKRG